MTSITNLQGTDIISTSDSMATINTNFTNLNSDKIETSYIDTDTSMAANSDTKIATQKATKTYIDTQGGANASETVRGIVEEATDAEVTAGTATGTTGAKLIVTPTKLATRLTTLLASYQPTMLFKCGAATYDISTASGTQNIAHGLGSIPKYVKLNMVFSNGNIDSHTTTVYNGTTQSSQYQKSDTDGSTGDFGALFRIYGSDGSDYQSGVITFDATNIIITWTKTGSPTGTANIMWEAQY